MTYSLHRYDFQCSTYRKALYFTNIATKIELFRNSRSIPRKHLIRKKTEISISVTSVSKTSPNKVLCLKRV